MNIATFTAVIGALIVSACTMAPNISETIGAAPVHQTQLVVRGADERDILIDVRMPSNGCDGCTLIAFSHGARSVPNRYDSLLEVWASAGYVVAAPIHVDSEEHQNRSAYEPVTHLPLRIEDMALTVSAMLERSTDSEAAFRLSDRYIVAGHSFGALIAQVLGGAIPHEKTGVPKLDMETNPSAVIAISPPSFIPDYMTAEGWSSVSVPMLVVTGTEDVLPGFIDDWRGHLDSYDAAPPHLSYAAVFEGMDHYFNGAFGRLDANRAASSVSDLKSLNELVLGFVWNAEQGAPIPANDWRDGSGGGIELFTRRDG